MGRTRLFWVDIIAAFTTIILAYYQLTSVTSSCVGFHFLGITLILVGVAFVILTMISCKIASFSYEKEVKYLKLKTLCGSMPLVLGLLASGIFAVTVSSSGGGKEVPGRSYKIYQVESYSEWMQHTLHANWDNYYKKAVVMNKEFVCASDKVDPAFQSGCCEAPRGCKLCSFNNHTSLLRRSTEQLEYGGDYCSDDCKIWVNDPNTLCFNCQLCKAGFLQDLTKLWFPAGIQIIILGIVLLWIQLSAF